MAEIGTDIEKAAALLNDGEVVAIPTETVYGLAANALSPDAVAKIFTIKKRPSFDPLIVHVKDVDAIEPLTENIPEKALELMEAFWPGPLTLILTKSSLIPDLVTSGLPTVGLRCPRHPLTSQLLNMLPFPLAAPSANPFGRTSPTSPAHVQEMLGDRIPYILDGGTCTVGIESTIAGFTYNEPVLYRHGGIAESALEQITGQIKKQLSGSTPAAPGQLMAHYATQTKLLVGDPMALLQAHEGKQIAVLTFRNKLTAPSIVRQVVLSPSGNLEQAAANLFAAMHHLDQPNIDLIIAEPVPNTGIGKAINDRLSRASN